MKNAKTLLSHRALCSAAVAGIAANAAPASASVRLIEDAELMRLSRAFEAAWSDEKLADAADVGGFDEPAYHRVSKIVDEIVDAPAASLAGLTVKARALFWLHSGDIEDECFSGDVDQTTDMRLAWQLLRGVLALGAAKQAKAEA